MKLSWPRYLCMRWMMLPRRSSKSAGEISKTSSHEHTLRAVRDSAGHGSAKCLHDIFNRVHNYGFAYPDTGCLLIDLVYFTMIMHEIPWSTAEVSPWLCPGNTRRACTPVSSWRDDSCQHQVQRPRSTRHIRQRKKDHSLRTRVAASSLTHGKWHHCVGRTVIPG